MGLQNGLASGSAGAGGRKNVGVTAASLVLAVFLMVAAGPSAWARVHSSIIVDVDTGQVLESHNADLRCYPASLTKLMTLYITFQQLAAGKMTLGEEMRVSRHAAAQQPTKLYLRPGSHISVRSAILGITTRSANDAAVVLAEAIGGKEWKFARLMNERAHELGMTRTTFRNASGLPNRYQMTTASDMSKLAMAIIRQFPQYYHFFSAKEFDFRGKTIYGHDRLLNRYPGVDGMKTGFTDASGFNIVTSVVRDHTRLLGVVIGGPTARARDTHMIALLNHGFARVRTEEAPAGNTEMASAENTVRKDPPDPVARYEKITPKDTEEDQAERPDLGWMVQVGGRFRSRYHARAALRSALHTIPRKLHEARPLVVKLRRGGYLARFSDMDESHALNACRALRDRRFTCNSYQIRKSGIVLVSARR